MITSPLDIPGGNCVVWLDATDTTTLSSLSGGAGNSLINTSLTGDFVGGWGDKSGNNRHFTNIGGSASTRPVFVSALSSVWFQGDGVTSANPTIRHYLTSTSSQTITAQTVFVVHAPTVIATYNKIFTQAPAGVEDATGYVPLVQHNDSVRFGSNTTNFFSFESVVPYRGRNIFDICVSRHTGTAVTNFVNGVAGSPFSDSLGTLNIARQRLGASIHTDGNPSGSLPYLGGYISEVIVYNRALTNAEREDVEYYLTRKWSVLNSIPRQVYAIRSGNWSNSTTWSTSADPAPWNFPLNSDNVYSNTFAVTADQNAYVNTLQTNALSPNIAAGGTFVITQPNITLTVPSGFLAGTTTCITGLLSSGTSILSGNFGGLGVSHIGNGELRIVGNVTGGSVASSVGATNNGNGLLSIFGNVLGGTNATAYGTLNNSSGNLTIVGNISGSGTATGAFNNSTGNIYVSAVNAIRGGTAANVRGIHNSGVGNVYITGNCLGGTNASAPAVLNGSLGAVIINGNVSGSTGNGIEQSSTGTLLISGTITASTGAHGVVSSNATARNEFTGSLVNDLSGRQAVYCAKYLLHPKTFDSTIKHAVDRAGTYITYYSPEAYGSSYVPHASSVAVGTIYAAVSSLSGINVNIPVQLSGTMVVPSADSVSYGTPVGQTIGTAVNNTQTLQQVWNTNINTLTAAGSIGVRLKNAVTVEEAGNRI